VTAESACRKRREGPVLAQLLTSCAVLSRPVIARVRELEAEMRISKPIKKRSSGPPKCRIGSTPHRRFARHHSISKGKLQLSFEPISIHPNPPARLRDKPQRKSRQKTSSELWTSGGSHVRGSDPARFAAVFWNLIKNSVKFTPEKGRH